MKWISKDGIITNVEEMSDLYLKNSIAYLKDKHIIVRLKELEDERERRVNIIAERPCPWCGHKMKMHKFEYEDPYPDVGFSLPDRWKQLVCAKCKAKGPEIRS